jgi:hypothetical protein
MFHKIGKMSMKLWNSVKVPPDNLSLASLGEWELSVCLFVGDRIQPAEEMSGSLSFNTAALQRYILHCAQQVEGGGLRGEWFYDYLTH